MRAFLAFEISAPVKEYLQGVIRGMASKAGGVRWVKSDGQHITLKFFGDIEDAMAEGIREKLSGLESKFGPFEATIKEVDAFPNKRRARVIVVTLEKGVDISRAIFHDIEVALLSLGIDEEKRDFTPHITLGRKKETAPLLERVVPGLDEMSFVIDRLVLFKSTLTPQGAIYAPVWEIGFKGRNRK
ncbi:MAG: 2-5 ligase [Deltaproteobacteria bacterium]|nr:2-5 ligase [Deltaproteobacteria bacterium]